MTAPVDFTACPRVPGRAYNGANGKKICVEFEGARWMLKFPPPAGERPTALSYTNSCLSEHLASSAFRLLGLDAQETRLGTFRNGREKVVCACRDFTAGGKVLYDFCSVKNTVLESETGGAGTELSDVLDAIDGQAFVDPAALRARFWDMFVADALLGNFDRHHGNWGFLVDPATGAAEPAPVFDCGSCLLPQADEATMRRVLADPAELDARIYVFPASMLKVGGRKINYADFLASSPDPDLAAARARIVPRIDPAAFARLVDDTPYLSDFQRDFYKAYFSARAARLFNVPSP